MSKEERDSHNSKAYVAALRQIAEMRPDQGHEAIRQAREILGMEEERWGCFDGRNSNEKPHEGGCLIGTLEEDNCSRALEFSYNGKTKLDCKSWRKY